GDEEAGDTAAAHRLRLRTRVGQEPRGCFVLRALGEGAGHGDTSRFARHSPDASVPATVVDALRNDGFDVAAFKPQRLQDADVLAAERVVAIGVDLGEVGASARTAVVRWDDIPPFAASYPKARQAIRSHIRSLLDDLERRPPDR